MIQVFDVYQLLCEGKQTSQELAARLSELRRVGPSLSESFVGGKSLDDVVDEILQRCLFKEVELCMNARYQIDDRALSDGRSCITIRVPFKGEPELLYMKPQISAPTQPNLGVVKPDGYIETSVTAPPEQLKHEIDRWCRYVSGIVDRLNTDARAYNIQMRTEFRPLVEQRLKFLETHRQAIAALEIPLKHKSDPPSELTTVPLKRRTAVSQVIKQSEPSQSSQPEYFVSDEEYNFITNILFRMGRIFENQPGTSSKMNESDMRNVLLVGLNGHYEGLAGGETFNVTGKTDLLISHHNKNAFIGECKIWSGPQACLKALDQLLSYVGWRDTKAALIIFSKNNEFTNVLGQIDSTVQQHAGFVERVEYVCESGFRYIFRSRTDQERHIALTVLAFNVADVRQSGQADE